MRQPLTATERRARRLATFRKSQAKRRAGHAGLVQITLSPGDALMFNTCMEMQRGAIADFPQHALLMGAKFLANSGNPIGHKISFK
jgi:hypothetical protein